MTTTADKTADPEPLECWIEAFSPQGGKYFGSKDDVLASKHHNRLTVPIHMREVTPQDEKDRKDAARYRVLKTAKSGILNWQDGWLDVLSVDEWDEMIDKAMEDQ